MRAVLELIAEPPHLLGTSLHVQAEKLRRWCLALAARIEIVWFVHMWTFETF